MPDKSSAVSGAKACRGPHLLKKPAGKAGKSKASKLSTVRLFSQKFTNSSIKSKTKAYLLQGKLISQDVLAAISLFRGVPKQSNSGHIDVPSKSCGIWKLTLSTDWPPEWTALYSGCMDAGETVNTIWNGFSASRFWIPFSVGSWIPKAGFWIPEPSILDSTSKTFLDSGLPYMGRLSILKSSWSCDFCNSFS